MKTPLTWLGNKTKIIDSIKEVLPDGSRLVDLFAGSCSLMMNTNYKSYLICDSNPDLINMYLHIKEDKESFLECLLFLFEKFKGKEGYLLARDDFNSKKDYGSISRSALFMYLNRCGFRGLCRYNKKGYFNTPYGGGSAILPLDEINSFEEKSQRADFICADYKEALRKLKDGDVIYCDPPYIGTFSYYTSNGFDMDEHEYLSFKMRKISKNHRVVISNSDCKETREIYSEFNIKEVCAPRGHRKGDENTSLEILAYL